MCPRRVHQWCHVKSLFWIQWMRRRQCRMCTVRGWWTVHSTIRMGISNSRLLEARCDKFLPRKGWYSHKFPQKSERLSWASVCQNDRIDTKLFGFGVSCNGEVGDSNVEGEYCVSGLLLFVPLLCLSVSVHDGMGLWNASFSSILPHHIIYIFVHEQTNCKTLATWHHGQ